MRRRSIAAIAAAVVLLVLVLAQLFLPGIAADNLRDRIARSGTGVSVEVDAFPAIELLWHQADKVVVHVEQYHSSTGHLSSLLDQAADVGTLDASAGVIQTGLLTLRNATLSKRGNTLTCQRHGHRGRSALLDPDPPIGSADRVGRRAAGPARDRDAAGRERNRGCDGRRFERRAGRAARRALRRVRHDHDLRRPPCGGAVGQREQRPGRLPRRSGRAVALAATPARRTASPPARACAASRAASACGAAAT